MNFLRIFHVGSKKLLAKQRSVPGTVTLVRRSALYVIKKPIRLYMNETNTLFSHFLTFRYTVDTISYTGKLFIPPQYQCPEKGETIEVFYDPDKPENYACYPFPKNVNRIGW